MFWHCWLTAPTSTGAVYAGSEVDVTDAFEEIFTNADGKIVVATFASSIYRMQIVVDLAAQFDRRVAFIGRGMIDNSEVAQRLGYLRIPTGVQIKDSDVRNFPAQDVVCLCTGSQGEPQAALPRIAIDDHRHVKLEPEDVVVFSAREIPGNEKAIGRVMNHIAKRGAELVYEGLKHVHVSGHGSEEELKLMLSLVRPRYFVPIHGEYRQLARHARIAGRVSRGTKVLLAENGDVIRFDGEGGRLEGKVPAGRILIDGTRSGEVGDEVLRDRRHLAGDGLVVPVVVIGRQSGSLEETPDVITRGFVLDARTRRVAEGDPGPARLDNRRRGCRGTDRPRAHQGEDSRGLAAVLPQTFRTPAAGAAGDHGDLTWPERRSSLVA